MIDRRVLILGISLISSVVLVAVVYVIAVASGFADDFNRAASARHTTDRDRDFYMFELPSMEEMIMRSDLIAVVNLESVSRGVERFRTICHHEGYTMTLDYTFEVEEYLKGVGEDRIVATVLNGNLARTPVGALLFERPDQHRRTNWDDRKAIVFLERDSYSLGVSSFIWKPGRYFLADTDKFDRYSVASLRYRAWLPAVSASADEQTFLLESDLNKTSPSTITLEEIKAMVPTLHHGAEEKTYYYGYSLPECPADEVQRLLKGT